MPVVKLIAVVLPIALGVVMIGAGGVNFAGPSSIREFLRALGISGRFSPGDGRARSRGRFASADPGDVTGWSDRKRHHLAGSRRDVDPLSRLGAPARGRGPDGGGGDSDRPLSTARRDLRTLFGLAVGSKRRRERGGECKEPFGGLRFLGRYCKFE